MKRKDMQEVIYILKDFFDDFETIQTSFVFKDMNEIKYEIDFEKYNGRLVCFQIKQVIEGLNENN